MKFPRRQFLHLAAGAAAVPALSRFAWGQAYPTRPIRLVVPFPPGGAFDTLARPWVEQVKPLLGTMIVENIGGGGSSLGAAAVARASPDGYTILLGTMIVENIGGGGSSLGAAAVARASPDQSGRLHHSARRHPPARQRGAAQEPAAL